MNQNWYLVYQMTIESSPINFKLFEESDGVLKVFCVCIKTWHWPGASATFSEFMFPKGIARFSWSRFTSKIWPIFIHFVLSRGLEYGQYGNNIPSTADSLYFIHIPYVKYEMGPSLELSMGCVETGVSSTAIFWKVTAMLLLFIIWPESMDNPLVDLSFLTFWFKF